MPSNSPAAVVAHNAISSLGDLPFYFPLNPLIFLDSPAALAGAWKTARRARKSLPPPLTTIISFGVCLSLILYLAPLIGSISADAVIAPAEEIIRRADVRRTGDKIRLVVEFADFIRSVLALRVWSAEGGKSEQVF